MRQTSEGAPTASSVVAPCCGRSSSTWWTPARPQTRPTHVHRSGKPAPWRWARGGNCPCVRVPHPWRPHAAAKPSSSACQRHRETAQPRGTGEDDAPVHETCLRQRQHAGGSAVVQPHGCLWAHAGPGCPRTPLQRQHEAAVPQTRSRTRRGGRVGGNGLKLCGRATGKTARRRRARRRQQCIRRRPTPDTETRRFQRGIHAGFARTPMPNGVTGRCKVWPGNSPAGCGQHLLPRFTVGSKRIVMVSAPYPALQWC